MFDYPIGWVLRPHGLRGELTLKLFRPRRRSENSRNLRGCHEVRLVAPERSSLHPKDQCLRFEGVRFTDASTAVVRFEGLSERDEAEAWVGAQLFVNAADAPSSLLDEADEVYGASVIDAPTGAPIGNVRAIVDNGAQPVLVIGEEPNEVLVPFVDALVLGVRSTAEGKVVELSVIEGLLDLNRKPA